MSGYGQQKYGQSPYGADTVAISGILVVTASVSVRASVKASANKSKRTWFIIGFVSGLGTRLLARW